MAGLEDCYTSACGQTATLGNFAKATFNAIAKTYSYLTPDLWKEEVLLKTPYQLHTDYLSKTHEAVAVQKQEVKRQAATQGSFETFRRSIHTSLLLPLDRPMFRRANAVSWVEGDKLVNVHHGLE